MDILAPAGSPEGLIAAIKGGCDAVYLAGKSFGARAFANNFTDQELEGAVNYAHEHGVKVNVTVNTLIKDSEMEDAVSFVQYLKDIGADAIIIQDLGLLKAIQHIPIKKHASTQMAIHSRAGLEWCAKNGLDRAILARELTLEEIEDIVKDSPIETEVFVQGAMCYCQSGGCLFSSIVGGRSGNRGECAQPCRKRYESPDRTGYLLSNADIFCIDYLQKLDELGVSCVKIEGRMRSEAYAYLASKAYSTAYKDPDSKDLERTIKLLKTVFNRGFCHGYMDGVSSLVQSTYPDNRGMIMGNVKVRNKRFSIEGTDIHQRDGISLYDGDTKIGGFKILTEGTTVTSPFAIPDGRYDVYRTYDPRIDEVKNLIGRPPKLTGETKRSHVKVPMPHADRKRTEAELSFYVSTIKVLNTVLPYADRIYYDGKDWEQAKDICEEKGKEFVYVMPRFSPKEDVPDDKNIAVMVHNAGQAEACCGHRVYGSYLCNMFNSFFPDMMHQTTLSVELSKHEIKELLTRYSGRVEIMMFGRIELMLTRDPHLKSGYIKDEKGYSFPVYRDRTGYAHILNSSDLMLLNYVDDLERAGVNSFGIDLRKRPAELAELVAKAFSEKEQSYLPEIKEMCGGILNTGHYLRGV
ncbi:MAG: U32 family peptidase [Candidatus Methanomethylophilaceae archaeon]|nr:U32 family peptidase [Candidatus Methanomethylophilaceae archaeon]